MYVRSMSCCGVREISGLSGYPSAPAAMRAFVQYLRQPGGYPSGMTAGRLVKEGDSTYAAGFNQRFRYVFFTQANPTKLSPTGYGFRFAAFIRKHKLGEVVIASEVDHINPNSNNHLAMWTWTVNQDALSKWAIKDATAAKRVKAANRTKSASN